MPVGDREGEGAGDLDAVVGFDAPGDSDAPDEGAGRRGWPEG